MKADKEKKGRGLSERERGTKYCDEGAGEDHRFQNRVGEGKQNRVRFGHGEEKEGITLRNLDFGERKKNSTRSGPGEPKEYPGIKRGELLAIFLTMSMVRRAKEAQTSVKRWVSVK